MIYKSEKIEKKMIFESERFIEEYFLVKAEYLIFHEEELFSSEVVSNIVMPINGIQEFSRREIFSIEELHNHLNKIRCLTYRIDTELDVKSIIVSRRDFDCAGSMTRDELVKASNGLDVDTLHSEDMTILHIHPTSDLVFDINGSIVPIVLQGHNLENQISSHNYKMPDLVDYLKVHPWVVWTNHVEKKSPRSNYQLLELKYKVPLELIEEAICVMDSKSRISSMYEHFLLEYMDVLGIQQFALSRGFD